jgi:bidirectional [NiFe] hydrogenase diaphorase subunit
MIKLTVDGKQLEVEEGTSLLQACLDNEIFVPNLCFLKEMDHPPGSCRMCFVELEGVAKPITSCNTKVKEGMVVRTDAEPVRLLQRTIFQLLFSAHHMECKNCLSRKGCQLQKLAKFLGVKLKARKPEELGRDLSIQPEHPYFDLLPARCILCHKCLYVCTKKNGYSVLSVTNKGINSVVTCGSESDPETLPCKDCKDCVEICPVSAILPKKEQAEESPASA